MGQPRWPEGPWHRNIKPGSKYPTIFSGRKNHVAVAATMGKSDVEVEAVIDLVVTAPELYKQLVYVMSILKAFDMSGTDRQITDAYETTKALLARARGEATPP